MVSGVIYDIQRSSAGGGTHLVVHLKGCPLRCLWCSTPEAQRPQPELLISPERCTECGSCAGVCQTGAIASSGESSWRTDRSLCSDCGNCAAHCQDGARRISGCSVDVSRLFADSSRGDPGERRGGTVTLAGGEPLLQPAFAVEMMRTARRLGYRTVLETSGHAEWCDFSRLLPDCDFVLYDLKHLSPVVHRRLTGVRNDLVLANLERVLRVAARVVVRMPLIPGCNADSGTVAAVAEYVRDLGVQELRLVPYHRGGEWKYKAIGRGYPLDGTVPLSDEVVLELRRIAERVRGLRVLVGT